MRWVIQNVFLTRFCFFSVFLRKRFWDPASTQFSVIQPIWNHISWKTARETSARFSWISSKVIRRFSRMNCSTFCTKPSDTNYGRPLLSWSCTLVHPSRNTPTRFATFWRFITSGPYADTSLRWMSHAETPSWARNSMTLLTSHLW